MKFISLTFLLLFISSCKPIDQRQTEADIKQIVSQNLAGTVPYDGLLAASGICAKNPDFDGCDLVESQIYDISLSYSSCLYDQRSKLCKAIIDEIRESQLYIYLPKTIATELPSSPFFWSLPTKLLEAQSSRYGYRDETKSWLWEKLKFSILSITLVGIVALCYYCFSIYMKKIQLNIEKENALEMARQLEKEMHDKKRDQQALIEKALKLEKEKSAEEEYRKIIVEEQRTALEAQIFREEQEKLAKEKAETEAMLQVIFKGKN